MNVLFLGSAIVLLALLVLLAIWKIRLPKRQTRGIVLIFCTVMLVVFCLTPAFRFLSPRLAALAPMHVFDYLRIALFVISFMAAFVITYSALEADSPTVVMLRTIIESGSQGIEPDFFSHSVNDYLLVVPRVNDLLRDKLAYLEDGRYKLTTKGKRMCELFIMIRKILGAGVGG